MNKTTDRGIENLLYNQLQAVAQKIKNGHYLTVSDYHAAKAALDKTDAHRAQRVTVALQE